MDQANKTPIDFLKKYLQSEINALSPEGIEKITYAMIEYNQEQNKCPFCNQILHQICYDCTNKLCQPFHKMIKK